MEPSSLWPLWYCHFTGKYADEIDIPLCDMEEEYLEEQEYEDEDEEE